MIGLYGCLWQLNRRNEKAGHVLSLSHFFTHHLPNHLIRVMNWMEYTLVRFAGSIKLRGTANILEDMAAVQRGLVLLKEWDQSSLMKFKDKCKFLHLFCKEEPLAIIQNGTGDSSAEEPLEVLADIKLTMRQQSTLAAKKANGISGFCGMTSELGKCCFLYAALTGLCLEYWASAQFGPSNREDTNKLDWVQHRATMLIGGCSICLVRRCWGIWACSSWSRDGFMRRKQQPSSTYKEGIKKVEPGPVQWNMGGQETTGISWNNRGMTRDKKKLFHDEDVPKEDIQSPCSLIFKTKLTKAPSNLSGLAAHSALNRRLN